jgi:hypothetical protein
MWEGVKGIAIWLCGKEQWYNIEIHIYAEDSKKLGKTTIMQVNMKIGIVVINICKIRHDSSSLLDELIMPL